MAVVLDRVGEHRAEQDEGPAGLQPDEHERDGGERTVDGVVVGHPDLEHHVDLLDDEPEQRGEQRAGKGGAGAHLDVREEQVEKHQGEHHAQEGDQLDEQGGQPGARHDQADVLHHPPAGDDGLGGQGDVDGERQQEQQGQVVHELAEQRPAPAGVPDGVHGVLDGGEDEQHDHDQADHADQAQRREIGPVDIVEHQVHGVVQVGGQGGFRRGAGRRCRRFPAHGGRRGDQLLDDPDRGLAQLGVGAQPLEDRGGQRQQRHDGKDDGKGEGRGADGDVRAEVLGVHDEHDARAAAAPLPGPARGRHGREGPGTESVAPGGTVAVCRRGHGVAVRPSQVSSTASRFSRRTGLAR